jgi:FkbM family methyltransferase
MILSNIVGYPIDLNRINDKSTVIDAGVCKGKFIKALREHSNCKIIGLEACLSNYKSLKNFNNCEIWHNALVGKNRPKEIKFYDYFTYSDRGRGSIFYKKKQAKGKKYYLTKVPTITIDKFDCIDYLKLDIEGAEYEIFDTMTKDEAKNIKQFSTEVHSNINYLDSSEEQRGKKLAMHIIKRVLDLGFSIDLVPEEGVLYGCR